VTSRGWPAAGHRPGQLRQEARQARSLRCDPVKTYLWWWAFLLAVIVIAAEFGASGSTRLILEIVAAVVFVVVGILHLLYAAGREIRRREGDE
jgi:hypothetical protein